MDALDKCSCPYLDTLSNRSRSKSLPFDERLFLNWASSRQYLYSVNADFENNGLVHETHEMHDGEDFIFPWSFFKDLSISDKGGSDLDSLPSELRPLVERALEKLYPSKDEQAFALLDILGPEHFELIQKLCSSKGKVISLPMTSKSSLITEPTIPGIYSKNSVSERPMVRHAVALPSGTIHECYPGREYFCLPAQPPSIETWCGISELEIANIFPHPLLAAGGKNLFPYSHFNRMQSVVFPTAFSTNENLLVCAPTGSGKTDVALIAILRVIWSHCSVQVDREDSCLTLKLDRHAFKIIYIAPMKALAAEISSKYRQRLGSLGIVVNEYTGDIRLSSRELDDANILVSTPEKWDVLTRNPAFSDSMLGAAVKLIIIDEVHLLQDTRGSVLETIVARTLRYVEGAQRMVRIIGLSATLPNFMDVAEWLRVAVGKGLFFFDASFRPVPLKVTLIGLSNTLLRNPSASEEELAAQTSSTKTHVRPAKVNINQSLDVELLERVRPVLSDQHQCLIFVHSRSQTIRVARLLSQHFGPASLLWKLDPSPRVELNALQSLLASSNGAVGIHHAGMSRSDRFTVENLFRSRRLSVLVCTSTLAWGVNLPARAVFIRGTDIFKGSESTGGSGTWEDLSPLDILQIFGRAGRPGLDNAGEATLLCPSGVLPKYLLSLSPVNSIPIESTFATNLDTHLNAEINLGTVKSVEDGISWLSYTFLWVRTRQKGTRGIKSLQGVLQTSIDRLLSIGLCTKVQKSDAKFDQLIPTEFGEIASRLYLSVETAMGFHTKLSELSNLLTHLSPKNIISSLIRIFSEASEFLDSIRMRSASGGDLEEENLLRTLVGSKLWLQRQDLEHSGFQTKFIGGWDNPSSKLDHNSGLVPLFDCSLADWTSSSTKVSILFQAFISGWGNSPFFPTSSSKGHNKKLDAQKYDSPDLHYITLNASRFLRAIFEISLKVIKNSKLSFLALELCRCFENRTWSSFLLSMDDWWNSEYLIKKAGGIPSPELVSQLDTHYKLQLQCDGWSRVSPLQLALFSIVENSTNKTGSIDGVPLISVENRRSHVLQVVNDTLIVDILWDLCCNSKKHEEVHYWAVISFPFDSKIIWVDQLMLAKNQCHLACKVTVSIPFDMFKGDQNMSLSCLYLDILSNSTLGLDVTDVPISLGTFNFAQETEFEPNLQDAFVHPKSICNSIPQEAFLLGRGRASLLFPAVQRPFLEVSRAIHSSILKEFLYSKGVYSLSAIQSVMARPLLYPLSGSENNVSWCNDKRLITILAPPNSGKGLAVELAIWGLFQANPKSKVLVVVPDPFFSYQLIQQWSFVDSIAGILGISPSSSLEGSLIVSSPVEILKWNSTQFSLLNSHKDIPLLVVVFDVEKIGDCAEFEASLTLLRYWTHFLPLCRWLVCGRPFSSAPDVVRWLGLHESLSWCMFCGPEVALSPQPQITTRSTNRMPGAIAIEISRIMPSDALLVVWVHSRRFCRSLASKLSMILARSQIGFSDESIFSFKDELLQRTISQSGVAFLLPFEKDSLICSSVFIKVLIVAITSSHSSSSSLFSTVHKISSGRPIDSVIILPHLQTASSVEASLYYSACHLSQMVSIAKGSPGHRRPKSIFMGPSFLCSIASSLIQAENGYKLPIESKLCVASFGEQKPPPYEHALSIDAFLMASLIASRQFSEVAHFTIPICEIESLFKWTFLFQRLQSNPSFYDWSSISALVKESLIVLNAQGCISFNASSDFITVLPACRLAALHSFSPETISKLDKGLLSLWKHTY
ncbi:putative steryl acetyl hydrolase mug81 [Mitosporidium daphniae]|uniref:Subunit 3 of activating signal cointegrator 1 complex n=1 Tax=Mitosporidium daphniae TaxID=1485682 RepID=A0A098VR97_9MICR|nr:subunit 3 of activating signal cointegrator 1 complex [Mitosporidium daphniae]KGG51460.1 subunit 3 of activating signal cointegrator 1 complex [Mitosporidium daphniae]|eukprot:XP_013237887.1 subunit 3 of activating signal cointegrator 1 complex [Mitosporidium daphniae]